MKDQIKRLEKISLALEPDAGERAVLQEKVFRYAEAFMEELPQMRAYVATEDQGIGLVESPISDEPISIDQALHLLGTHVDHPGENIGAPGNLAYIPISGLYVSALADYLAAITNRYATIFFSAPGAARIERMLLRWMAEFLGYPETAAGDLTSGGSMANLVSVVTAREAHNLKAQDYPRSVVYLSKQTHHSIEKALRIAGLKECVKRFIPLDSKYRLQAAALEAAIQSDKDAGLNPWLVVANAGTTDTGAVDPLDSIADLAQTHQLWMHVDGAYGAAFALCDLGKDILKGIGRSDSLIMNPHKGLFMPLGSGAVLVKEGGNLLKAYSYDASYLQDADTLASPEEVSAADISPELSRRFRGLRLWLALKVHGVAPFRAALEEKLLLTRHFYAEMQRLDRFSLGPPPDLSVATFRYLPQRGDPDEFNQKLIQAVQQDGRVFISSTTLDGKFTLRLAVLGYRTHLDTVDLALKILKEKAAEIEDGD